LPDRTRRGQAEPDKAALPKDLAWFDAQIDALNRAGVGE